MELAFTLGGEQINPPSGSSIPTGGLSTLQLLLSNFLTTFMVIGAFLMVIYIVWGGIQWITSGGDKQKLATARGRITWATVGFIIIMIALFILNAIGYLFRVDLLKLA